MSCLLTDTVKALRGTRIETVYIEQGVGFLAQDEQIYREEVGLGEEARAAAKLLERLVPYLCHDAGCSANDLDPMDKTPCTCGLRSLSNPWGKP